MNNRSSKNKQNIKAITIILILFVLKSMAMRAQIPGVVNVSTAATVGETPNSEISNSEALDNGVSNSEAPCAVISVSDLVPPIGKAVCFDAAKSTDSDGKIVSYIWDFDDGTTASGARVSHIFKERDDYKVVLTVTDSSGFKDSESQRIFVGRPQGWTEETHHKRTDCRYGVLFDNSRVHRIDMIIDSEVYKSMERDLAEIKIESGVDPIYAPVKVQYEGHTWWNVGMRYKGNSTLTLARKKGHKLPFRLNFDKFEAEYPEITNQRFYGFDKMTFSNNFFDASFLREKVCADIFRNGGVPAASSAFYRVFVDKGDGPVYWGLYTMIEDPSDGMLKDQFENSEGNLYKPEGESADWSGFDQESFIKKTNEAAEDWSDIRAALAALHASRSNAAAWRTGLEVVLDVNTFIRWLAINTAIVNWDSYGLMKQNYYVYQNLADDGRLVWFPWDLNMSMDLKTIPGGSALTLSLNDVEADWPLIRYLMDDPVYYEQYHQELIKALEGCMNETTLIPYMEQLHQMIRRYTVGDEGESSKFSYLTHGTSEFDKALQILTKHIRDRNRAARIYLNSR